MINSKTSFLNKPTRLLSLSVASILIVGCVSSGRKIDQQAVSSIRVGETTRSQVEARLGSPDQITQNASGETVYEYNYYGAQTKAESFIPIAGSFIGGHDIQNQRTTVTFDRSGIVSDYSSTAGSTETGYNLSASQADEDSRLDSNKRER